MGFSIGGLLGSNSSAKKAASIQQMYTKEQMQNQHQWEMADLKAANLNPALTLGDTSGASGSAGMPNMGGTPEGLSGLLNSAINAFTAKKQAETGDTQGQLNLAQAGKVVAETKGIPQQLKNDTIKALAAQTGAQAELKQAQIAEALAPEQKKKTRAETSETKERTKKQEMGLLGNVFGTNPEKHKGKWAQFGAGVIAGMIPYGKAIKLGKKIKSAKQFGNFLNTIK